MSLFLATFLMVDDTEVSREKGIDAICNSQADTSLWAARCNFFGADLFSMVWHNVLCKYQPEEAL